jgi:hypothetical protein
LLLTSLTLDPAYVIYAACVIYGHGIFCSKLQQ